jgi:eukaryotic-like serine/threonine-protein kinase
MTETADQLQQLRAALDGTYDIERELVGGGMSRVFVAREKGLNREVVIKVLSADVAAGVSLERFSREIQLAASLQQANIVPLLAAGEARGIPYFTMPYVQGESLRRRLSQGPLSIAECMGILRDVARALSYAHARGVVHRDIKPDNVLLSHGAAMVTDFGIAKAVSASKTLSDGDTLTSVGSSLGTPAYMSPEQVAADPHVDHRADLYAWGCMAYELLAGAPPFVKDSPQRVMAAHLTEPPAPIATRRPDVPPRLEQLIMKCLAKEPADRPATADDVLHELDAVVTPSGAVPDRSAARGGVSSRRRGARVAVIATGIAAVVVTAVLVVRALGHRSSGAAKPAVVAADRSIAVLPLSNLSGDKSDDYFGIGLAEEMTRALSKTGVRVIGRVSAGALQAKGLDERAIARELGVGSLLTGSVQRAAGQVRINVSLLSADGTVRWTDKYDRPLTNVFAVQDEIARAVAEKLLGALGVAAGASRVETSDPEAYSLFLQAQVLFGRRTSQTLEQSISLFERAVARDPKFARAQASLAMALGVLPSYEQGNTVAAEAKATAAARRAIAIDSTIAESYIAIAYADMLVANNRGADTNFHLALALDSTVATAWGWYGLLASHVGAFDDAHGRIARARELEPASLIARAWDAQTYTNERRYAKADSIATEAIAVDSTFALTWSVRAEVWLLSGRGREAVAILERQVKDLPPHRPTETHGLLAYAYARMHMFPQARALLETLRADNGGRLPATGVLACALEELGDHEGAIALLGEAVSQHDAWLLQYTRGERYDKLRRDPRGAALLTKDEAW